MILRSLWHYPEIVDDASKTMSPNTVCTYLFLLAQQFNSFYGKYPVLDKQEFENQRELTAENHDSDVTAFRLSLTAATAQVIKNGLHLLGIQTVEKM
jgi:arginyl-tRNA synthetase